MVHAYCQYACKKTPIQCNFSISWTTVHTILLLGPKNKSNVSVTYHAADPRSGRPIFISFRGSLKFGERIALPPTNLYSCTSCDAPCFTACPVRAFASGSYDVTTNKSDITGVYRKNCLSNGYAARRSCPLSQNFGRLTEQSSFHMRELVT